MYSMREIAKTDTIAKMLHGHQAFSNTCPSFKKTQIHTDTKTTQFKIY